MKKAIIYLFSGTGNTKKAVLEFAERLRERGTEVTVSEIDGKIIPSDEADAVGIAYPIHAFNAPENVVKFVKGMPNAEKELFIIKTCGEPLCLNNASSALIAAILRKKGYRIVGEYGYVMPYNMLYRHSESMATKMWFAARRRIAHDTEKLTSGAAEKVGRATVVSAVFRRVEQPFMRLNGRHFKVDTEKCIECGKCARSCPQKNIKITDGKFTFGKNCVGCVRCSFNCPVDAINIGLINFWKVNGRYSYGDIEPIKAECKYLKRAYRNYFEKSM